MASTFLQSVKDAAEPGQLRRLTVAVAFTLPLVAVAMGPHILMLFGIGGGSMDGMSGMEGMEGMDMEGMEGMDMGESGGDMAMGASNAWLQLVLATPVVLYSGAPYFQRAWHGYRMRAPTMDILVAIGVTASFGYSLVATFAPDSVPTQDLYYETAAVIITLVLLGRLIERMARRRATANLRAVLAGAAGSSAVGSADAGTWLRLLEDAQVSRTGAQRVLDRLVSRFVPIVLLIATLASIYWMTAGAQVAERAGLSGYEMSILSLVGVVIVACPCALGLATPLAVASATGQAAKQGILIRGGQALDAAHRIDTIVFNEAATLAHGAGAPDVHLKEIVARLAARGVQARLMTAEPAALAVEGLGQDVVADKDAHVASLQAEGRKVAVVTDAQHPVRGAQLTIAIGLAQSAEAQAGHIVLPKADPHAAATALEIAADTRRRIWQNLAWAFGYNVLLVPVAAGLLVAWPLFGDAVVFDPMLGAAAMTLSILSVVANSTRGRSTARPSALPTAAPATTPGA